MPDVARPGVGGYVKGELIYPLDERPTPQCHASTIVETRSGLVAAWFGGTRERHDDVGIRVSRKEGEGAWSRPVRVADGSEGEDPDHPCWNPVLFRPGGPRSALPVVLFYKVGPSPGSWWGMLMTSADEGRTWSGRRRLCRDHKIGHLLGPVKNKPVQLEVWMTAGYEYSPPARSSVRTGFHSHPSLETATFSISRPPFFPLPPVWL